MAKSWVVQIPIAGHIEHEVEAETEEEAKQKAWEAEVDDGYVSWEMLHELHRGNVCFCPSPWEVAAEELKE